MTTVKTISRVSASATPLRNNPQDPLPRSVPVGRVRTYSVGTYLPSRGSPGHPSDLEAPWVTFG